MNKIELEKEQKLIEVYINQFYERNNENLKPITDGVIDAEKYLKSKFRICWVLKEPYDDIGGGWSLTQDMLNQEQLYNKYIRGSKSWEPVVYVTYSLFNNFISYSDMSYISDQPEMAQCFNNIAYINMCKMPANTRSNYDLSDKYEFWKPILHWQLKQYDPQIIIFGGTFPYFKKDLGITDDEIKNVSRINFNYAIKNNKMFLDVYHPAQTTITRDIYVQGIIDIVKENINKI
jgi:hypothetical protein